MYECASVYVLRVFVECTEYWENDTIDDDWNHKTNKWFSSLVNFILCPLIIERWWWTWTERTEQKIHNSLILLLKKALFKLTTVITDTLIGLHVYWIRIWIFVSKTSLLSQYRIQLTAGIFCRLRCLCTIFIHIFFIYIYHIPQGRYRDECHLKSKVHIKMWDNKRRKADKH